MFHSKEIEEILARGNDVMIRRRKENGKLVDVIFEIRPNIVEKQTVPVQTEQDTWNAIARKYANK
jgi:hypothetical protein